MGRLIAGLLTAILVTTVTFAGPRTDTVADSSALDVKVARAVDRGLQFLARSQRPDGESPTYAWRAGEEARAQYVRTPFTASQILHSLTFVGAHRLTPTIAQRTIRYLIAHREAPGVWRYYGSDERYYAEVKARFDHPKLPPDVDDTSQAWAALSEHGHAIPGAALEALRHYRTSSGLFSTWMAPSAEISWMGSYERKEDLVANANVLFAFARAGQALPEVCTWLTTATRTQTFAKGSVWYPNPLVYAYVVSRAYKDGPAPCLADAVSGVVPFLVNQQQGDGSWGGDLETALALVALLNAGVSGPEVERAIHTLIRRQAADGGWAIGVLYKGAVLHYGSRGLTTAFVLEAFGKAAARGKDRPS